MLQTGTIINDTYQIEQEIGAGGGGVVYRAKHLRLNTEVVVKQIHDSLRGKIAYRQEADVLKQLKHPYLPRVYDFIETDDAVYTVMDFIPGTGLDQLLKKYGSFQQNLVMRWAIQLGEALAYLHSQKPMIIHSDIKPANIIITPEGNVCLIDFNVSVVIDDSTKSSIGVSLGYSPPEQYRDIQIYQKITCIPDLRNTLTERVFSKICGSAPAGVMVDARSDIYSLGCVLYHALTGHAPNVNFERIESLDQSGAVISEGLRVIIEKMMQIYPENRYQDGRQYLDAIRNCYKLDHRYLSMRRREKMVAICAACFFIAGAGLTGFGMRQQIVFQDRAYENQILDADSCMEDQDFAEAITLVEQLQEEYPTKLKAYERELYYLYASYQYDECLTRADRIFADQIPNEKEEGAMEIIADIYYIRANANYETDHLNQAITDIEQAIKYDDSRAVYYRDYSLFLAKTGNIKKAKDILKQAKHHDLENDSLRYIEAEIAYSEGDYESACEGAEALIDRISDEDMKRRAIILCLDSYKAMGEYDRELELIKAHADRTSAGQQLVLRQYEAQAYIDLAGVDTANAAEYENKALEIFEDLKADGRITYRLEENIAILYENMGQLEAAEKQLLQMEKDYPDDYRVYKRLAFLEADKQQQLENADRDYKQMNEYYQHAKKLYEKQKNEDMEMQALELQMQDVIDGGWLD